MQVAKGKKNNFIYYMINFFEVWYPP